MESELKNRKEKECDNNCNDDEKCSMETELQNRKKEECDDNCNDEKFASEKERISKIMCKSEMEDLMTKTKSEILDMVDEKLQNMFNSILESIDKDEDPIDKPFKSTKIYNNGSKDELPKKEFVFRDSTLTILLKISHIRTVYHMFVAIMIIFSANTMITDIVNTGAIFHLYHYECLQWAFGKLGDVAILWLKMQSAAIFIYPIFLFWLDIRSNNPRHYQFIIDRIFLAIYIIFQVSFLILPLYSIFSIDLPPCSSAIVICENIRFMMKCHAFIRENVAKGLEKTELFHEIDFSRYLYFLFAPTLVYRDSYPRNKTIRWPYVASNFAQVILSIIYMYYIFARFCTPYFSNFNSTHVTLQQLVVTIFGCMLPGTLLLLITFFCFLHSWLNAFAEMLQFGDRMFYKEWWNSTTFSNYYRTWNVVVHDWLYSYIYRDVYYRVNKSRSIAMTVVFLVSAIVHEYVLIVMFRFFFPVLFILFGGAGFGMVFLKGRTRLWNIGFWVAMFIGTGILMCLYSMEWYARINCPLYFNTVLDIIVPRSFFCSHG